MQVDEIMLTLLTTMLEPPAMPACVSRDDPLWLDAVEPPVLCEPVAPLCEPVAPLCAPPALDDAPDDELLGDAELLMADDEPPMRPVTMT